MLVRRTSELIITLRKILDWIIQQGALNAVRETTPRDGVRLMSAHLSDRRKNMLWPCLGSNQPDILGVL